MDRLKDVAVIGALGKMGRGIALLILLEQAWLSLKEGQDYWLRLIDVSGQVRAAKAFFRDELKRSAEKRIIELREGYKKRELVSNEEMIETFVQETMDGIEFSSELALAKSSRLIFEAALEDVDLKVSLLKTLKEICPPDTWFFTNTSSIPIHVLNERAHLEGRIIGFHFYNPPTVQRLMEIIPCKQGLAEINEEALKIAKLLKKIVVVSNDIAGFIGNGFLLREIRLAFQLVHKIKATEGEERALVAVDRITREWLLRPMGIFQLMDFVGIDVCLKIAKVMREFGSEKFSFPLLEKWPKKGLFVHEEIFSFQQNKYIPLPDTNFLGERSQPLTWKSPQKDVPKYFESLFRENSPGASLAKYWLEKDVEFMYDLVQTGVAKEIKDVSEVLKLGFYHHYSPDEVLDVYATFS